MSKDEMSHDHITGDFQISQNLIGSCYYNLYFNLYFICCRINGYILVEKPKYFWIAIVGVIIAFLILKLSKLKLFQFSRITKSNG